MIDTASNARIGLHVCPFRENPANLREKNRAERAHTLTHTHTCSMCLESVGEIESLEILRLFLF